MSNSGQRATKASSSRSMIPVTRWLGLMASVYNSSGHTDSQFGSPHRCDKLTFMRGFFALICVSVLATAQEDHSQHAHGGARLGTVNFANSCTPAVAGLITRGVALLHSFAYEESRLAFREAAAGDPACAVAHW